MTCNVNKNEILSETAYVNQRFLPYFGREASRETLFRAKKSKKVCPKIAQNHSCRGYPETLPRSLDKFGDYGGATRDSSPVTEHTAPPIYMVKNGNFFIG